VKSSNDDNGYKIDMSKVTELTKGLRSLGCAVCVVTPEDVIPKDMRMTSALYEQAASWFSDYRWHLEEFLCEEASFWITENESEAFPENSEG
jgi:hypothetical protein